jgi:hypothetical protein
MRYASVRLVSSHIKPPADATREENRSHELLTCCQFNELVAAVEEEGIGANHQRTCERGVPPLDVDICLRFARND